MLVLRFFRFALLIFACFCITVSDVYADVQEDEGVISFSVGDYDVSRAMLMGVIRFELNPGWHIYASDAGDLGLPTKFSWPKYVSKANIHWPKYKEEVINVGGEYYKNHIYDGIVIFPVRVYFTVRGRPEGVVSRVGVVVDYSACKDVCIPRNIYLETKIDVGKLPDAKVLDTYNDWFVK